MGMNQSSMIEWRRNGDRLTRYVDGVRDVTWVDREGGTSVVYFWDDPRATEVPGEIEDRSWRA